MKNRMLYMLYDLLTANVPRDPLSQPKAKGKTFEVLCGSSVLDAPIQMIAEIPQGAKICQRKACLASIDHFLR